MYAIMKADGEEKEKIAQDTVNAVEKEIEPLLKDAGPFFGGKSQMTMAEVRYMFALWKQILTDAISGHHRTILAPILCIVKR